MYEESGWVCLGICVVHGVYADRALSLVAKYPWSDVSHAILVVWPESINDRQGVGKGGDVYT
jgi:hypothetical protein